MSTNQSASDNYEGAFDKQLALGRSPALILIDFVEAYFAPDSPLFADVDDALASALRVREAAHKAGIPVILTNVVYHPSLLDGGRFADKVLPLAAFSAGNPMGDWPSPLTPSDDELVISKQYPSAFFGTSLASTLTANGIDSLLITGLTTSGCVRATCVDCISSGFIPVIVEEACGDRHESPHRANLFDMQAKYGEVISEQAAVDYLRNVRP
ncbi:MAG: isochorismatase family protein [Pseudomonadota bacterium]